MLKSVAKISSLFILASIPTSNADEAVYYGSCKRSSDGSSFMFNVSELPGELVRENGKTVRKGAGSAISMSEDSYKDFFAPVLGLPPDIAAGTDAQVAINNITVTIRNPGHGFIMLDTDTPGAIHQLLEEFRLKNWNCEIKGETYNSPYPF